MQGDKISTLEQIVKFDLFHTHFIGFFLAEERIKGDDLHLQTTCAVTHDAPDVTGTDHAQCFGGQFNTHELGLFPFPCMCRCRGFGDLTSNREHHRDRMFCCGDHVAKGGVHNDHALFRRGLFVNVIDADPCAADDLELGCFFKDRWRDFGCRPDRKTIIVADDFGQFFFVFSQLRHKINVDATITEDLNSGFAKFIRNEYFGCHFKSFL